MQKMQQMKRENGDWAQASPLANRGTQAFWEHILSVAKLEHEILAFAYLKISTSLDQRMSTYFDQ